MAPILTTSDAVDDQTYARPLEARVTHLTLDLDVDFDTHRIGGTAALDIRHRPGAKVIVLDDNGLEIDGIADQHRKALPFKVGARDPKLGSPLAVALRPDTSRIVITYKSAPDAGALQWLTPQQTAGGKMPFLLSQGEAIENRSWIPTQDSPGIRQSWEATIRVPAGMTAVMSAPRPEQPITEGGEGVFNFRMDHPVASYMIALAVGDIAFRSLGPRTGVWAEPATLPAAAAEFSDTEKMVSAAEKLYGPYRWGRYDVLVLPPSFPFGGMENPNMTFLTPTVIAGDKSLVNVVAHELAHSWSGNLATNATWNDGWLNEGMATYAERRIVEALYGEKQADEQIALGIDTLNDAIAAAPAGSPNATRLHTNPKDKGADDSGEIAYEKGSAFLRTIEAIVGRPAFDGWLKGYFNRHAFQPVTSAMFLADIRQNLVKGDPALENKLMLDRWVYQSGIPTNMARPPADTFADQDKAVRAFATRSAVPGGWGSWTTDERLRFLNRLPRKLPTSALDALQSSFRLNESRNSEVRFAWLDLAVANRYDPVVPSLQQFLTSQGRGKFVEPLFKRLAADAAWGAPIARRTYPLARRRYHPVVTRALDPIFVDNPTPKASKNGSK
ncbi:M1 family metallopeptidase [Sphingomonas sp.]|uniref:M1 family metallopeptidase n=1 Tax=Sphingomonas sp. TaxID=28214 RepID=UPI0025FE0E52|nr:M1 family metallopeptidase [Sphingomonas sp.]